MSVAPLTATPAPVSKPVPPQVNALISSFRSVAGGARRLLIAGSEGGSRSAYIDCVVRRYCDPSAVSESAVKLLVEDQGAVRSELDNERAISALRRIVWIAPTITIEPSGLLSFGRMVHDFAR